MRIEAFNVWNWHNFGARGGIEGGLAFDTDLASPDFGNWTGGVSDPRVVQVLDGPLPPGVDTEEDLVKVRAIFGHADAKSGIIGG